MTLTLNLYEHKRKMFLDALNKTGSAVQAAAILGISHTTMYRYIKKYNFVRKRRAGVWYECK